MNRTQAKARFTELTACTATSRQAHQVLWNMDTTIWECVAFNDSTESITSKTFDARTTEFWTNIVNYLEWLMEVA